ncbi:MAG: alpha/beta fold hydrolase [Deltaproteobacteria bacterium]|nr:alpha/beta fold hydrolase [Deltaproteobacteria bacterium]MBW2082173.1 alpha/beta fold hydrolase [Deltaproteobacteria bacterium]
MPHETINGCRIYYEIHGEGEPLVLIMGLRRNLLWWYRQIPTLSQHFKVLAFDNRGAGRSDKPDMEYSIGLFADDTAGLTRALGLEDAHILGISMGGYIAQELALNHPDLVRDLILGCTSCGGSRAILMSPERMKKFTANEGLTPEQMLQKDMDIYFSDEFIRENPDKIEEFIDLSLQYYQPPEAFQRQFDACLKHDTVDRLKNIKVPTMIVAGDDDPLVPSENSRILKELIPHAELVYLPGCRHCFFIEEADKFNHMAIEFFKSHSGR